MAKKYGKNELKRRGCFRFVKEDTFGINNTYKVVGEITSDGKDDRVAMTAVQAFGDTAEMLKKYDGAWIQIEGASISKPTDTIGRYFTDNTVYEIMELPMHKEEKPAEEPPPPEEDEDIPF